MPPQVSAPPSLAPRRPLGRSQLPVNPRSPLGQLHLAIVPPTPLGWSPQPLGHHTSLTPLAEPLNRRSPLALGDLFALPDALGKFDRFPQPNPAPRSPADADPSVPKTLSPEAFTEASEITSRSDRQSPNDSSQPADERSASLSNPESSSALAPSADSTATAGHSETEAGQSHPELSSGEEIATAPSLSSDSNPDIASSSSQIAPKREAEPSQSQANSSQSLVDSTATASEAQPSTGSLSDASTTIQRQTENAGSIAAAAGTQEISPSEQATVSDSKRFPRSEPEQTERPKQGIPQGSPPQPTSIENSGSLAQAIASPSPLLLSPTPDPQISSPQPDQERPHPVSQSSSSSPQPSTDARAAQDPSTPAQEHEGAIAQSAVSQPSRDFSPSEPDSLSLEAPHQSVPESEPKTSPLLSSSPIQRAVSESDSPSDLATPPVESPSGTLPIASNADSIPADSPLSTTTSQRQKPQQPITPPNLYPQHISPQRQESPAVRLRPLGIAQPLGQRSALPSLSLELARSASLSSPIQPKPEDLSQIPSESATNPELSEADSPSLFRPSSLQSASAQTNLPLQRQSSQRAIAPEPPEPTAQSFSETGSNLSELWRGDDIGSPSAAKTLDSSSSISLVSPLQRRTAPEPSPEARSDSVSSSQQSPSSEPLQKLEAQMERLIYPIYYLMQYRWDIEQERQRWTQTACPRWLSEIQWGDRPDHSSQKTQAHSERIVPPYPGSPLYAKMQHLADQIYALVQWQLALDQERNGDIPLCPWR
jgi:hypothetical protein